MHIEIEPGIRLFVDIQGPAFVPDGSALRELPTLICLHGGPGFDHSGFKPGFAQLADVGTDHLLRPSRARTQRSPASRGKWTLDTWADDVVKLCAALGIEKPIVLGQSFGGFVAQRYLARHPQHPQKVILSSTSHHLGLERKLVAFEQRGGIRARELARAFWSSPSPDTWQIYWTECRALYNTTAPADAQSGERVLMRPEILLHFVVHEMQSMELLSGLGNVCCPVLVMVGEEDPVCPLVDALEIVGAIPAAWVQLARFPGVGHGAWRDDPEAAFTRLRQFIQS